MSKINVKKMTKEEKRALKVRALVALEMNKGSVHGTAKKLGIARSTLLNWARANEGEVRSWQPTAAEIAEIAETAKDAEQTLRLTEDKLHELATLLVDSLIKDVKGEGEKVNFYQRSGTFNIVFPALQLLAGKATSITEKTDRTLTTEERIERAAEVLRASNMQLVPKANGTNGSNGNRK